METKPVNDDTQIDVCQEEKYIMIIQDNDQIFVRYDDIEKLIKALKAINKTKTQ